MIEGLRDYQQAAVTAVFEYLATHDEGNPCVVAPTGAGKSWIIAGLCSEVLDRNPAGRVLVLSHVKELLQQDAEKLLLAWPSAPLGIYSAGLRRKEVDAITVAGIQSVWKKADKIGHVDVVIVDEAHMINASKAGTYRAFLGALAQINPAVRIIGLTATPYRLGQGLITDGDDALFDELIDAVSIEELIKRGLLAPLRSKFPAAAMELDGVHTRGGEFIEKELQAAVDTTDSNSRIAAEICERAAAENRHSWLVFCTGVDHALHMRDAIRAHGIAAETVTGQTPAAERAAILDDLRAGRLTCVTNANVLTTGFDSPRIDLLAFCRPTLSPGLYVQMAGRGMRPAEGKTDCLVLDFGGNVMRHGPITAVEPPAKRGSGKKGAPPMKHCPQCGEIVLAATRSCPSCGYEFPAPTPADLALNSNLDIMGRDPTRADVTRWLWYVSKSRSTGIPMLVCDYQPAELDMPVLREYLCLLHGGYAEQKGFKTLRNIMRCSGLVERYPNAEKLRRITAAELPLLASILNSAQHPATVEWLKDGKYQRIVSREWIAAGKGVPANG